MKNILMIAYHYPPIQGSSGVHRTLSFSKYLPQHGWKPTVLTVSRNALPRYLEKNERMIPEGVDVIRSFALDTEKHLSIGGKYPQWLATPDRLITWLVPAVIAGYRHIRRNRPDVLYSTYPIATAHLVGYWLHRITGIPWVADFRDPMAQEDYPPDPRIWRSFEKIEKLAMRHASRVVFAAPGALRYYLERYPSDVPAKGVVIENGFDEEMFAEISNVSRASTRSRERLQIVHSGVIYPSERDPSCLFKAVRELKDEGSISASSLEIILRGCGHESAYAQKLVDLGIDDIVNLAKAVDYQEALTEMSRSDALLLLQAENCNSQIPAKLYEYIRVGRPIIALTDPRGDTAGVLRQAGGRWMARLDSVAEIVATFRSLITDLNADPVDLATYDPTFVRSLSREFKSGQLVDELNRIALA